MMETIRVTADEQQRIAAAAAARGVSKQRFCLAQIMQGVERTEAAPEPEAPPADGMFRIRPFEAESRDIPRATEFGSASTCASQYQTDGFWYFENAKGQIMGVMPDDKMQEIIASQQP